MVFAQELIEDQKKVSTIKLERFLHKKSIKDQKKKKSSRKIGTVFVSGLIRS